ncbi:transitional endoplasmic reticulum ATPase [Ereboglobus sp. PH5-5]|uniref:AAA family ATPase n=1 Tax=Ereboglobus sp. PH5-5 TaxID=2940529 RepID=UPI0024076101|nr:ATP-binding protein [Ereboglobus sp. PH5-5]MDF9833077.1 transitional endoplasmic reticulum ATPase [Ereboglobus sp. PH5-5]
MSTYKAETSHYAKRRSLEFFANFIRNHDGDIEGRGGFKILSESVAWANVLRLFTESFSKADILSLRGKRTEGEGATIDASTFNFNMRALFNQAWELLPRDAIRGVILRLLDDTLSTVPMPASDDSLQNRMAELQAMLSLSDLEKEILLILYFVDDGILEMPKNGASSHEDKIDYVAKCLNRAKLEVRKSVAASGKLRRYNCIDHDIDFTRHLSGFISGLDTASLGSRFYGKCDDTTLPWSFFGNLAVEHGAILKNIITSRKPEHGVHILLHGEPGTGKTSFARSLARELALDCYAIAQTDSEKGDFGGMSRDRRFAALQICDAQIDRARSLLIVDEADNLLRGGGSLMSIFGGDNSSGRDEKALLNGVLDTIKTPTVWITNLPACALDESTRRRFDYSIQFNKLTGTQRLAIWKNSIRRHKLESLFDDASLEDFARRYETNAGGVALALRNIANLAPRKDEAPAIVAKLLDQHCELLGIKPDDNLLPAKDYSLEGLNIKSGASLARIVEAVGRFQWEPASGSPDRPRMNLLLSGPPGTGKTEFVKFLGKTLDTKIIAKAGSDLISKWLGESEKNIANAFRQAKAEKAILFLDEIDSLLQSREGAQRSWEITQVNELLQQMEKFGGVLIAATNFSDGLDPASLRRFTFKLEFGHLDAAGKKLFFERMFGTPLASEDVARLEQIPDLAPGDFRTVRQSLHYLGTTVTNHERLAALEQESHAKKSTRYSSQRRIGF